MPLNIKNEDAHRMAKELAELTGSSITDAVTGALKDALKSAKTGVSESKKRLIRELDDIAIHCAALPLVDGRSPDEILGYNDDGLPG